MTRTEALVKLLALGPMIYPELLEVTGWPREELDTAIASSVAVTWRNGGRGQREYMLRGHGHSALAALASMPAAHPPVGTPPAGSRAGNSHPADSGLEGFFGQVNRGERVI